MTLTVTSDYHASVLLSLTLLVAALTVSSAAAGPRVLQAGFADSRIWSVHADEPWWALVDLRDMLNLFHPLSLPRTGGAAGATATLTIPADWRPPFALRFFCADDYFADAENHKPGQLGTESFFGHRFKQVLVDNQVVWERDITDENTHGSETVFSVDLTPHVTPGQAFKLTFRVWDKVTTTERNERDVWFIGGTWYTAGDGKTEEQPRFHTAAWFADPVVGEQAAVDRAPAGQRPHEAIVAARHRQRWPLPPLGESLPLPVTLRLVAPAAIPAPGFPITGGVPMPPGLLRDAGRLRLTGPGGQELALQTAPMAYWPDGSLRWVLVTAIAPGGVKPEDEFRLRLGSGTPAAPQPGVTVRQTSRSVTLDTGAVTVALGESRAALLDRVVRAGEQQPALARLRPRMTVVMGGSPTPVKMSREKLEVTEAGPVRAVVEMTGSLTAGETRLGQYTCRVYVYAGLPSLQVQFRITNHLKPEPYAGTVDDPPLEVTDLALVADLGGDGGPASAGVVGKPAVTAQGGLELVQDTAAHCRISSGDTLTEDRRAQGWIAAGDVQASLWRFWQQFPKSLAVDRRRLTVGLFTATPETPAYRPRFGEAKRHDLWLTFGSDQHEVLGLLADEPPRLFDGDWFCRTGGIAHLDPQWPANYPKLWANVQKQYGDFSSDRFPSSFGLRNFGDMPYKPPQWLNGYWAMVQGALNWGLASGDRRWVERGIEITRHIADVDTVHLPPDHPDWREWNGMTCALGSDHSVHDGAARWPAFQLGESLLLHYWMTGDADSRDAGLANADYLIRQEAGLGSSEARSQARPMLTLLRAWQATGDGRYREAARRYLALDYQIEKVIDWRRGTYIQPTYQNWRCVSAGLDSMYAINIYDYYRLTGDLEAAQLVVAVADSVYAESMLPQEEGLGSFIFYIRYSRGSWYYTQMAILFHMAYDLTGEDRFLRAGRAAFARYLLSANADGSPMYQPVHNFGWLDPEFGGWALRFADVPTAPFTITSQTPQPDPANY